MTNITSEDSGADLTNEYDGCDLTGDDTGLTLTREVSATMTYQISTDRSEYSRFEPDRCIIKARVTTTEATGTDSVTMILRRKNGPVIAEEIAVVDGSKPISAEVTFDTSAMADSDGTPTCIRGAYEIAVYNETVTDVSLPFFISIITAAEFRRTYCKGLPLTASLTLSPRMQPSAVTGVTISQVSESSRPGFKPLVYSAADHTLTWNGGPAIAITADTEILPGARGDYVEVSIDSFLLPTADASESILIDKSAISDEELRRSIDKAVDEIEHDLDMNIEPLRVATEPYYGAPEDGEWFDRKMEPIAYYAKDFNLRGMGWHLDLAVNQLLKVDKVEGFIGHDRMLQITSGGYQTNKKAGLLDVMPYAGQYVVNYLFFVQLQFWGSREFIAGFWRWKGKAGIERMEGDILRAVGYRAAVPVLITAGQAATAGASSMSDSKDGVSASRSYGGAGGAYGAAITEYKEWMRTNMAQTIKRYRGFQMVVL